MDQDMRMSALDALLRLAIDVRRHIELVAGRFDLTPPMARMVLLLSEPLRMSEIADAAGCEPSHVTGLARQLEAADLAARRVDPHDRRARRIELTAQGHRLRSALVPALLEGAPILTELNDDEVDALLQLIEVTPRTQ